MRFIADNDVHKITNTRTTLVDAKDEYVRLGGKPNSALLKNDVVKRISN